MAIAMGKILQTATGRSQAAMNNVTPGMGSGMGGVGPSMMGNMGFNPIRN